jgi:hypothetical protein
MARHNNIRIIVALAGILALANASFAQICVTSSDSGFNVACGTRALGANTTGFNNTAIGDAALGSNSTGSINTAAGTSALISNTTGNNNVAVGYLALGDNSDGGANVAIGVEALTANTVGNNNTALGHETLWSNTTGNNNTATGFQSLLQNTSGSNLTAVGYQALLNNTTGSNLTAVGYQALDNNGTGSGNSALGYLALFSNSPGSNNSAHGYQSMYNNTTGSNNTALGYDAMFGNTTGGDNIAIGYEAGYNVGTGHNNIEIGNKGVAGDAKVIKIGIEGVQSKTFIAGISTTGVTGGVPVYVTSTGQLGFSASSERYKTDVTPLDGNNIRLNQLRPVSFHVKTDPNGAIQFGLIAEEVDKVYPELVIRDDKGTIQGVRYDELAPMLVSQVQKQQETIDAQTRHAATQDAEIAQLKVLLTEVQGVLAGIQSKDRVVARR